MADRGNLRQQLAQARNVFKQFRNTPQLKEIAETYLAFEPEDREDHEFAEALSWALVTIHHQGILIAAHNAAGGAARYRKRVKEINDALLRQLSLECEYACVEDPSGHTGADRKPPSQPGREPRSLPSHLRVIPGGKGKTGS